LNLKSIKGVFQLVKRVDVVVNSIAILPIRNITGNPQDNYFCEGISEDLIFRLSRVNDVYVHPLEDVLALGRTSTTPEGIRKALGVKYLVLGSLQHISDSLSIQLELFETKSRDRLYSERYCCYNKERFSLLSKVSQDLLFQIVGRVSGESKAALAAHSSSNIIANDLYLQARQAQRQAVSWNEQTQMIKLYESAVSADSSFALARAYLAVAYASCYDEWTGDTLWIRKAKAQAEKAVALAPDLPEAYFALGKVMTASGNYIGGEKAYNKALELRPDYREPRYALAELYWTGGRLKESMALFNQLLQLSREFGDCRDEAWALHNLGWRHHWLNEFDISQDYHKAALKISRQIGDDKGEIWALYNLGMINRKLGKYEKALKLARETNDRISEIWSLRYLAQNYLVLGDTYSAAQQYLSAMEILKELDFSPAKVYLLAKYAKLMLDQGNITQAQDT